MSNLDNSMQILISTSNGPDIDLFNNQIVREKSLTPNEVSLSYSFPTIDEHGHADDGEIVITAPTKIFAETKSLLETVFDYHGITPTFSGNSIIIKDIDYLATDSLEAIETSIKAVNQNLKA